MNIIKRKQDEISFRKRRRELLIDSIMDLKSEGIDYKHVAEQLGIGSDRVSRIVKKEDYYLSNASVEKYLNLLGIK